MKSHTSYQKNWENFYWDNQCIINENGNLDCFYVDEEQKRVVCILGKSCDFRTEQ